MLIFYWSIIGYKRHLIQHVLGDLSPPPPTAPNSPHLLIRDTSTPPQTLATFGYKKHLLGHVFGHPSPPPPTAPNSPRSPRVDIYTSIDSGNTWVQKTSDTTRSWYSITSSADGNRLAAVVQGGYIYTSIDSGNTWIQKTSDATRSWYSITSSADGTKLAAVVQNGHIYTSIDGGQNWTQRISAGSRVWLSIASSADGTKLAAVVYDGYIYTSIDSGNTWVRKTSDTTRSWYSITSSADGNKLAAVVASGYIYTSSSFTPELSVNILTPVSSTTVTSFTPFVSFGSAVSCEYSWNGIDWNTLNCANNGTDISRPTSSGTSTLYVKGTDSNNVTVTKESTFSYSYYVWCGDIAEDSNWSNPNNWYTNNNCSVSTGSLPTISVDAYVIGSVSPIINTNTWTQPASIDSTGLTGLANTSGVIFTGTNANTLTITGNTTFNDSTYNTGIINGNAIFNTSYFTSAIGGILTIPNGSSWTGTVGGTVYGSDNNPITNYVFNGNASNLSTINGNATFNNNQLFTMGTINGTATLNGLSQTLSGINNVINFFKQAISRDTLFFTSGSTLNISGLATILGLDANNLLTVRSTNPGLNASLNINGTNNLDYLRIKDISNGGTSLNLSLKTVFDDGHNFGFTFKQNSTPGNRGGTTGSYVTPYVPVSHGGIPPVTPPTTPDSSPDTNPAIKDTNDRINSTAYSGTVDLYINPNFKPIDFDKLPTVYLFNKPNRASRPLLVGLTTLPNVFDKLKTQEELSFIDTPAKFLTNVYRFIQGLGKGSTKAITNDVYLKELGIDISNEQSLAKLHNTPVKINTEIIKNNIMFRIVKSGKNTLTTYLTYDSKSKTLAQLVKVVPGQLLSIISNSKNNKILNYKSPDKGGQYVINGDGTSVPIIVEVLEIQKVEVKKEGFWTWLWGLFR
jgi:hypothetical protein